jgi:hypothetical protein
MLGSDSSRSTEAAGCSQWPFPDLVLIGATKGILTELRADPAFALMGAARARPLTAGELKQSLQELRTVPCRRPSCPSVERSLFARAKRIVADALEGLGNCWAHTTLSMPNRLARGSQQTRLSGSLDRVLLLGLLGIGGLRRPYRQHTLAKACFDLVSIDAVGQVEHTLKRAKPSLGQVVILVFLFLFFSVSPLIVSVRLAILISTFFSSMPRSSAVISYSLSFLTKSIAGAIRQSAIDIKADTKCFRWSGGDARSSRA